jgi:hypothetical protein
VSSRLLRDIPRKDIASWIKSRAKNILRKFGLVLLAKLTFARTANARGGGVGGSTDLMRGAINPET